MELKICDLHIHVVPNVDDGSFNLTMSLDMLAMAYEQGVREVYCTSHNVYDKEELARQNIISEIKQLESQFDPHFLFNALELIKYMAKIAPDEAGKVIVGFSSLLRESINNTVSEVYIIPCKPQQLPNT